jgi:catechol 2,3-dioxygenase-like lactoylglutathione lyase family enzyme
MTDQSPATAGLKVLHHVHHTAFRCRDAEQTRWFYEDILGLPLAAALMLGRSEADGENAEYMHLFFEMGDGNHIAFFDEPGHARPRDFDKKHGFDLHLAFEVPDETTLAAWRKRLDAAHVPFSTIDHGFLNSVYFYDPNGIRLEITCKSPTFDSEMAAERSEAREKIADWTKRTRRQKAEIFGDGVVDRRDPLTPDLPSLVPAPD